MVVEIYRVGGRSEHHGCEFPLVNSAVHIGMRPVVPTGGPAPAAISKGVAPLFLTRAIGPPTLQLRFMFGPCYQWLLRGHPHGHTE